MCGARTSRLVALCLALCLGVCLLFLYVHVQGGQQLPQPGSGVVDKLRLEMSAQNEMNKKLQDQNRVLQFKIDKMQGDLHDCRTESVKHGEQVQRLKRSLENDEDQNSNLQKENEMIKKLQEQGRDLQPKIDKMQGDLQRCRTESRKHGELVQELESRLENNEDQNSNLRYSLQNYRSQSCKSEDNNIWWFIVTFVLGFFLGCCLGLCSK